MHRAIIILSVLGCFMFCAGGAVAEGKRYLAYETYKKLLSLCPEVKGAKLEGLLPAADDAWSKGQLRMPEETHILHGDFNHDGKRDCAIVITGDGNINYILIAEEAPTNTFKRTGLVKVKGVIAGWNGRALIVGTPKSYVAWTGKRYDARTGALAEYCYGYETSDFQGTMLKMTYIGPQDEPYPGLLISTFYRHPNLEEFKKHRRKGVHYGNDDMKVLWNLSVTPATLKQLVETLNKADFLPKAEDRTGTEGRLSHSLSILDTSSAHRPNYCEVFLEGKDSVDLLKAFSQKVKNDNGQAAALFQEYAKMFGG